MMNEDFRDLLAELLAAEVDFVVVGAHALAAHGVPRATGDLDVLLRAEPQNAVRVLRALAAFGAPVEAHGVSADDFASPGQVYQMGQPPRRIDLLTTIDGVTWEEIAAGRVLREVDGLLVPYLGRDAFIKNKRAAGRPKDLLDVALLEEAGG